METPTPTGLFATAYLPPIAYFSQLIRYEQIAIEWQETYPKQTYRNRAEIPTANGMMALSVPVIRVQGNHTRTEAIAISYNEPWNVRHWRAIVSAYNAAPYFLYYRDYFEHILMKEHSRLIDLNEELLKTILRLLKIDCKIVHTEDYIPAGTIEDDYRSLSNAKSHTTPTSFPAYSQVFDNKQPFLPNMSIIDLLFNLGPEARSYLKNIESL